jgi:hypothetical protein
LVASLSLIVYYCNHPPLRKAIFGEAKEWGWTARNAIARQKVE